VHNQSATSNLDLSPSDKNAIQNVFDKLSENDSTLNKQFLDNFADQQEPAWQRYVDGIYNHPKTWWIGIIHLQMLMGLFGEKYQAQASIRQNALTRSLYFFFDESNRDKSRALIKRSVRFNLKYRKADIAGRFHGGLFTNYASSGGRRGSGVSRGTKWAVRTTNFSLASFGAAIQTITKGLHDPDAIINAIITGKSEKIPFHLTNKPDSTDTSQEESNLTSAVSAEVYSVNAINNLQPAPVPLDVFCSKPENVNLTSICN